VTKLLISLFTLTILFSCQLAVTEEEGDVEGSEANISVALSSFPDIITGDRYFVSNKLVQMFGPSDSGYIYDQIRSAADSFGGACDRVNPDESCRDFEQGRTFTTSNIIKSGRIIQVCEKLIDSTTSLNYFLNLASLTSSSDFTKDNLTNLYKVVFPIKSVNQRFIDILYNQKQSSSLTVNDHWKVAAMALCQTPAWHVL